MAVFEKSERLRHIGHLDIQRAVMRALRRSGLPVSYSKGFNPHILLTFASALSTGAAGRKEIMDVQLDRDVTPEEFLSAMNGAMPPDMQLSFAKVLDDRHVALMAQVQAADYTITLLDEDAAARMMAALPAFLAQESILTLRKTKSGVKETDIRPLLLELSGEGNVLHALMTLTERLACKPNMLIEALSAFAGVEAPRAMVVRNGLLGLDESGKLVPLEKL
ncbi:MAG: TIGR03936 family radical SAM-associated protein [Aristaeellaceae bacterium]